MTCNWCKEKGHGWNFCEKRKETFKKKEEKQKKMDENFPATIISQKSVEPVLKGWANAAKQNRDEKIVENIKLTEEQIAKKAKEDKEKARADYLERVRLREEHNKIKEAQYVNDMRERFGIKWFNWVDTIEGGKYDSNIAAELRYQYDQEELEREYEYAEMERQQEERAHKREKMKEVEDEEKKRTLAPQAYRKWRAEMDEHEMDETDDWLEQGSLHWQYNEIEYLKNAPPLYREHYAKTCQQLNWREKVLENRELSWPTKK